MNTTSAVPITAEQRAAFDRDGYLIIRGVLGPDEAAAAREALDRLIDHPATFPYVWSTLGWNIHVHHSHLDVHQLRLEGELVSGRLSVQRRSGTLAATHRSPLAQLRDLAALGRTASANRTRIESWKTRPGSDRQATARSD